MWAKQARTFDGGAIAIVCGPLIVALVRVLFGSTYIPSGDTALIEMNVRDVAHIPTLGVYSRFDWNHPGPALYYLLAAPYRAFGGSSTGLLVGALLLNVAAIVGAALVARRVGGRVAMYGTLAVIVLVLHGLGSADVMSPWNPELVVLPTLVVLVSAWAVASGHVGGLPLLAIAASFVVQTHAGYGPVVAALVLVALVFLVVDQVRTPGSHRAVLKFGAYTAVAVFVMWLLPVVQQFTHHPGNLQKLVSFSRHAGDRSLGDGAKIVASAYSLGPPWLVHSEHASPFSGEIVASRWGFGLVTLALLAAAVIVCIVRRAHLPRPLTRLVFLLGAVVPFEIVAVAKIVGPAYSYLLEWLWVLAAATWLTLVWLAATLWPRAGRVLAVVVAVVTVGFAGANFVTVSGGTRPDSGALPGIARTFTAPVIDATRNVTGPIRVQGIGIDSQAYAEGLQLQLARHGRDALAPDVPLMGIKLRSARIDHGDRAPTVLTVAGGNNQALNEVFGLPPTAGRDDVEMLRNQPGFREIATYTVPPTGDQLQQTRDTVAQLQARGAITPEVAQRIVANDAAGRATFSVFASNDDAELPAGMSDRR